MSVGPAAGYPRVHPRNASAWRRWLEEHHATERGVWLVQDRDPRKPRVAYDASVEEALCYGWIDSVVKPLDDARTMTLFTPRRPGSGWARSNKERVERLIREKRMRPAGLAKIEAAKRDGSWTLLDSVEALEVPADLRRALGAAGAKRFAALSPSARKQHLAALVTAKKAETRAKRIADIVRALR